MKCFWHHKVCSDWKHPVSLTAECQIWLLARLDHTANLPTVQALAVNELTFDTLTVCVIMCLCVCVQLTLWLISQTPVSCLIFLLSLYVSEADSESRGTSWNIFSISRAQLPALELSSMCEFRDFAFRLSSLFTAKTVLISLFISHGILLANKQELEILQSHQLGQQPAPSRRSLPFLRFSWRCKHSS